MLNSEKLQRMRKLAYIYSDISASPEKYQEFLKLYDDILDFLLTYEEEQEGIETN